MRKKSNRLVGVARLAMRLRGVIEILETSEALRTELGMKEKLPHYSTLAKFCERSAMLQRLGQAALRQESQPVAIDATGLETSTASAHFVSRSKKERKKWVKLSVAVLTTSLLPLGAVLDWG